MGAVSETKTNPGNCKNCSSKCAYDCVQLQYTQGSHSFGQKKFQDFSRTFQYPKNIFPGLSNTPATCKYRDKQKLLTTYMYIV